MNQYVARDQGPWRFGRTRRTGRQSWHDMLTSSESSTRRRSPLSSLSADDHQRLLPAVLRNSWKHETRYLLKALDDVKGNEEFGNCTESMADVGARAASCLELLGDETNDVLHAEVAKVKAGDSPAHSPCRSWTPTSPPSTVEDSVLDRIQELTTPMEEQDKITKVKSCDFFTGPLDSRRSDKRRRRTIRRSLQKCSTKVPSSSWSNHGSAHDKSLKTTSDQRTCCCQSTGCWNTMQVHTAGEIDLRASRFSRRTRTTKNGCSFTTRSFSG